MPVRSSFFVLLSKAGRDETPKDRLGLDLQSVVVQGGVDFSVEQAREWVALSTAMRNAVSRSSLG